MKSKILFLMLSGLFYTEGALVDLSHLLNDNDTLRWPGFENFKLTPLFKGWTNLADGTRAWMEFNEFCSPEHLGTHMDAPTHVSNTMTNWKVHEIPIERLIGDAVVINITARAMANPDSVLTVFDLEMWEAKHGQIPDGSIVLMYSGWDTYWGNKTAYFGNGDDDTSNFHFPGFSEEACKWLVKNRAISGIGVDTISIDTGSNLGLDVHRAVLSENIYGLENLMNLGRLPAAGARLYVFPMKIKGGSGAPTRVVAEFDPSDVKPVSKAGSFKLELVFICIMTILGLVTN